MEKRMDYASRLKKYLGLKGNLMNVSSQNKYRPYFLDYSETNKSETIVTLVEVGDDYVVVQKDENDETMNIPFEQLQLSNKKDS
ncbi:MAG: hypothetical protein V1799_15315 [bacterium]